MFSRACNGIIQNIFQQNMAKRLRPTSDGKTKDTNPVLRRSKRLKTDESKPTLVTPPPAPVAQAPQYHLTTAIELNYANRQCANSNGMIEYAVVEIPDGGYYHESIRRSIVIANNCYLPFVACCFIVGDGNTIYEFGNCVWGTGNKIHGDSNVWNDSKAELGWHYTHFSYSGQLRPAGYFTSISLSDTLKRLDFSRTRISDARKNTGCMGHGRFILNSNGKIANVCSLD